MEKCVMRENREILQKLYALQDAEYRVFHRKLVPTVDPESVIGVRVPALRALAKTLAHTEEGKHFLTLLPHEKYEENSLHALILNEIRDYDETCAELDLFLPHVDNWAVCDVISPKSFQKAGERLRERASQWRDSTREYTIRFGIRMFMDHFLKAHFCLDDAARIAAIDDERYYVKMAIAWYFATALAFHPEEVLVFFDEKRLTPWCHAKAIQKAIESYRVKDEVKQRLKALR